MANAGNCCSDPRVVYDPGRQRYFVTQINVNQTANIGNQVLFAVSKTSNPLDGFKAVNFSGFSTGSAPLADFPTLAVDHNAVYISTNNFNNNSTFSNTVTVWTLPKTDATLATGPSLVNLTTFNTANNANTLGFALQGANGNGTSGDILAISNSFFNQANLTVVVGAGTAGATLGATTVLTGLADGSPIRQRQPDGTRTLDGGDDRFSAGVYQQGRYLYAANSISDNNNPNLATHDIVH
jgi:hypothetical protein